MTPSSSKDPSILTTVAESIGSTLGAIASKVESAQQALVSEMHKPEPKKKSARKKAATKKKAKSKPTPKSKPKAKTLRSRPTSKSTKAMRTRRAKGKSKKRTRK